jgi:hypothetical protein
MISVNAPQDGHRTSKTRRSLSPYALRTWLVSMKTGGRPDDDLAVRKRLCTFLAKLDRASFRADVHRVGLVGD